MASRLVKDNYSVYKQYSKRVVDAYTQRTEIKAFTELLMSLVAIILFALFAIRPTVTTIAALRTELENNRQTLAKLETKVQNLTTARDLLEARRSQIDLLEDAVPSTPSIDKTIRQTEGLSQSSGSGIASINTSDAAIIGQLPSEEIKTYLFITDPNILAIPYNVDVLGDFAAISTFLKNLENARRPLFQESVTIISDSEEGTLLRLSTKGSIPVFTTPNNE